MRRARRRMEPLEFFLPFFFFVAVVVFFLDCWFPSFSLLLFHSYGSPFTQPPFARRTHPANPHACFAYSPHVLPIASFARGRDICIHPTRPRLATCSNPPPNMVEKLYVTYNDVCIPYYLPPLGVWNAHASQPKTPKRLDTNIER